MVDVQSLAEEDTKLRKESVREYSGSCPGCGGNDRFHIRYDGIKWVFMCRNCWDASSYIPEKGRKRGWGDAIDYLRHFRGMSYLEAKALVAGEEETTAKRPKQREPFDYRSDRWQNLVAGAMKDHIAHLWQADDSLALDYLRARGFLDKTIRQYQFGYTAKDGIPRLVVPSINDSRYTTIYMRDLRPDVAHNERWKNFAGSSNDELYLADCLRRVDYPVVLTESALDAISIAQSCLDLVNVVATGGIKNGKKMKPLAQLARSPLVLVAFDTDREGEEAAQEWCRILPNAQRLRPILHDVNDMLIDHWDIRAWVREAIENTVEKQCRVCQADINDIRYDFFYDSHGHLYCDRHNPVEKTAS